MTEFLKYILESGIALAVFYLFYHIGLKRETCFAQNRLYLLVTPLLSFLLPLFELPLYFYTENPSTGVFELSPVQIIPMESTSGGFTLAEILIYLYLSGMIAVFLKAGLDFWKLNLLIEKYRSGFRKKDGLYEVSSPDFHATFSFLNFIFRKEDPTLSEADRKKIRKHELIHVRQKHSYDIIYIKILCAVFWFNPIIWMYRKALENTHEFLADHSVIDHEDKYSYIRLLVSEVFRDSGFETVHHFGKSMTSKRIEMMKLKSYISDKGRFLLLIPLSLVMVLVFSFEMREVNITELDPSSDPAPRDIKITISKSTEASNDFIRIEDEKISAHIEDLSVNIEYIDSEAKMAKALELINTLNLELSSGEKSRDKHLPEFPGGMTAWNSYIQKNLKVPDYSGEGHIYIEFMVRRSGKVDKVRIVRGMNEELNRESLRVIRSSPDWKPATVKGEPTEVKMIVPLVFKFD